MYELSKIHRSIPKWLCCLQDIVSLFIFYDVFCGENTEIICLLNKYNKNKQINKYATRLKCRNTN